MDIGKLFEVLLLPSKILNMIRVTLAEANVSLPAWAMQLIVLIIAGLAARLLYRLAKRKKVGFARSLTFLGCTAFILMVLIILTTSADYALLPLRRQLYGNIVGASYSTVEVKIISFENKVIGYGDVDSVNGLFVVTYEPPFADPPAAVVATALGCSEERVELTRPQLRHGAPISIRIRCGKTS